MQWLKIKGTSLFEFVYIKVSSGNKSWDHQILQNVFIVLLLLQHFQVEFTERFEDRICLAPFIITKGLPQRSRNNNESSHAFVDSTFKACYRFLASRIKAKFSMLLHGSIHILVSEENKTNWSRSCSCSKAHELLISFIWKSWKWWILCAAITEFSYP